VGAIVVEEASAVGVGNMHYDPPADYELEFDEAIEITYLHVTENRIRVTGD
jgi:hypothetical protein